MSLTASARRPVLTDLIARPSARLHALALDAALVVAGAAFVALLAQVEVPLWPVPITGQTLAVVVVGAALGARRGAAALTTYLLAGLAGLPVFAGFSGTIAAVAKPSFGFIIGFIGAAFVAGWFAERAWDRRPLLAFVGFVAASVIPFLFGVPYMALILNVFGGAGLNVAEILDFGLWPFVLGGVIKAALAAGLIPAAWLLVRAAERRTRR
ncbi:biotin transporter BioY [Microbacterium sp. TNHR37B]|uniref:biotin transporter BioY n=1 Tax=Microbacterium sp. TNHR37B TaxID=1775956 RepID=UPI0007B19E5B|nr:biotin transporter BioY [Microbacterium sp. TNHR37B]KZE90761.1 Biotin transporter BioY [Microbacterium sp. TNHR37B]